jgi:hypothetical protein
MRIVYNLYRIVQSLTLLAFDCCPVFQPAGIGVVVIQETTGGRDAGDRSQPLRSTSCVMQLETLMQTGGPNCLWDKGIMSQDDVLLISLSCNLEGWDFCRSTHDFCD